MQRVELAKNVHLHVHPCEKFKDTTIEINCVLPIELTGSISIVLAFLLDDVCMKYQTKKQATKLFDDLYGADFEASEIAKGKSGILKFTSHCIDDRYVKDDGLLEKQIDAMHEFIMHPWIEDGLFYEPLFIEARSKAATAISMALDDASSIALENAQRLFGGLVSLRCLPLVEDVMKVTNKEVIDLYYKFINESCIDAFILGNVDEQVAIDAFKKYFVFKDRFATLQMYTTSHKDTYVKQSIEKKLSQSAVCLLYEDQIQYTDHEIAALMIGNGILGGLPTSLLFQVIREQESLCYTIGSENLVYDGLIQIGYECDRKQIDRVQTLVEKQIKRIQDGDFSDALFDLTKRMYKNSWYSSRDFASSMIWDDYRSFVLGYDDSIESMCKRLDEVSKKDVMDVFKKLELKVEYQVLQKEETDA